MLLVLPIVVLVRFPEGVGWREKFPITFLLYRLSIIGSMKGKLASFMVYWYVCLLLETKMQWDYFHKDSFRLWTVMYCCLHLLKVACEIDLDLALFLFDLLYVQFFSLLMRTIQDKVGIPNCGTLCISVWYSFNRIVSQYVSPVHTIQYWIHETYILRKSCLIHWCSGI